MTPLKIRSRSNRTFRPGIAPLEPRAPMATVASGLAERLADHRLDGTTGRAGIAVVDTSGQVTNAVRGSSVFGTSSTIKLGVLYALMRRVDRDPTVTLGTPLHVGNQYGSNQASNPNDRLEEDKAYSLRRLAELMIQRSNNWATNRLMNDIGVGTINNEFANLGFTRTRIDRYNTGTGSPSMHGLTSLILPGPTLDYRAGHDNESTPFEMTSLLRRVHENNGLLTPDSHAEYWRIMGLNGDGFVTREYDASVFTAGGGSWGPALDLASKPGFNPWEGTPGTFTDDPTLGDHFQRSEAGRIIFSDGRVVFYAMFVDEAANDTAAIAALGRAGFEIAREFAPSAVTVTPAGAELDDGRVAAIRGNAAANTIQVDTPTSGHLRLQLNGASIREFTSNLPAAVYAFGGGGNDTLTVPAGFAATNVGLVSLSGGAGADRFEVTSSTTTRMTLRGDDGADELTYRGPGTLVTGPVFNTIRRAGFADVTFTGIETSLRAPTIAAPGSLSVEAGVPSAPFAFTVGDVESPATSLVVTASSSDTTLIPAAGIRIAGTGADRTITLTPAVGRTGSATITLRVVDETGLASVRTIAVQVRPDTTPPKVLRADRVQVLSPVGGGTRTRDAIRLTLSEAVNPGLAVNLNGYRLAAPGPDGRLGTGDDTPLAIGSATYNAATNQVTLIPIEPAALANPFQLVVVPTTLVDLALNQLDGDGDGIAGEDYVYRNTMPLPPISVP